LSTILQQEKMNNLKNSKQVKYFSVFFFIGLLILCSGCAYYNTFYNARRYFEEGEKARLETVGESLPSSAKNAYQSVIDKSIIILNKYPQSKYVFPAMFLIGKSRYHLGEYTQAENIFRRLGQEGRAEYQNESQYWLALTKWKSGKPLPALNDLHTLYDQINDNQFLAKIHLSIAEIYLEIEETDQALVSLDNAADLTKDRSEKDQIYYRLSTLAFDQQEYDRALSAYRNVIKYTMVKKRKEDANLQIVTIYRIKEKFSEASNKIKDLLADENFKTVHGELEMELAKISIDQGDLEVAKTRFESITIDYERSEVSAEAYYHLGENSLKERGFEEALNYYEQVSSESRKSAFLKPSQRRIKEIQAYRTARNEMDALLEEKTANPSLVSESDSLGITKDDALEPSPSQHLPKIGLSGVPVQIDSTSVGSKETNPQNILSKKNQIAEKLYSLAELNAFHFDHFDSAIVYLQDIIENYTDTDIYPKSLFTLRFLFFESSDTAEAVQLEDILLEQFPESEFSLAIGKSQDIEEGSNDNFLRDAEQLWAQDKEASLNEYKSIVSADSTSDLAAKAVYSLAYHYDLFLHNADSALKYYEMIQNFHPESEQASVSRTRYTILKNLIREDSGGELEEEKQFSSSKTVPLDSIPPIPHKSVSQDSTISIVNHDSVSTPIDTTIIKHAY